MKPILVHMHIYYPHLYKELKECVLNIAPHKFDLFVTMVEEHSEIILDIKKTFPNAKIDILENRGYDVGPFICVINKVNLDDYDYVVKLHTKRDILSTLILYGYNLSGNKWRKYLLLFMLKNNFKKCLNAFNKDSKLGMVSNFRLIFREARDDRDDFEKARKMIKEDLSKKRERFVAGTMFMCRANCLRPLQELNLKLHDFSESCEARTASLAHVIERYLGLSVIAQNYTIEDVYTNKFNKFLYKLKLVLDIIARFIYYKKNRQDGGYSIKICKIPVFRRRK